MDADPAPVWLLRYRNGGPLESSTVVVESRAGPRRDNHGHGPVGTSEHRSVAEIEGKILSARPDIVPLGVSTNGTPAHEFLLRPEDEDIRVPERPGRVVVDLTDAGGKSNEPIMDCCRNNGIGEGQGEWCVGQSA